MPLSPAFTVGQSVTAPYNVVFTDTSTGSDVAVVSRRIYVTNSQGAYVVQSGNSNDYITWPLATNPITVDLLDEDIAVNVLVQWLDAGNAVLYELDNDYCLREFNIQQFIYLIQQQALTPGVVQDTNYYSNLSQYWINIVGANVMIEDASDLAGSQNCLNRATYYLTNESNFF